MEKKEFEHLVRNQQILERKLNETLEKLNQIINNQHVFENYYNELNGKLEKLEKQIKS